MKVGTRPLLGDGLEAGLVVREVEGDPRELLRLVELLLLLEDEAVEELLQHLCSAPLQNIGRTAPKSRLVP